MSNLLGQLENNEAILLMYLAGELPEEDRAEVEQTLANDAALRGMLAELTALQAGVDATFATCDAGSSLLSRREAAVRRLSRALVAAQARPEPRNPAIHEPTGPRFRVAWWAYPIAAAAAIVVGMVFLSGNDPIKLKSKQFVETPTSTGEVSPTLYAWNDQSMTTLEDVKDELAALNTPDENLLVRGMLDAAER
jgi:hypothetical protein